METAPVLMPKRELLHIVVLQQGFLRKRSGIEMICFLKVGSRYVGPHLIVEAEKKPGFF